MTTLIEDLQALLNPLVAGGSHYAVNELEAPTYPYIVFQFVVSTDSVCLSGPSDLQNTRVQIDVYSRTVSGLAALADTVDATMFASAITNIPISSQDIYESDVKAWRRIRDYSVWSKN